MVAVPECEVDIKDQFEEEAFTTVHGAIIAVSVGVVVIIAVVAIVCIAKRR